MGTGDEKARRRRGRPSVLSGDAVLKAAVELSAADPLKPVSITTVARHLNVTSMAIYKYFGSRDELLQALSAKLLEDLSIEIRDDMEPLDRIECWLRGLRDLFLKNKQLINLLSWEDGHVSVAWENQLGIMFEALQELGFDDDEFAETAQWIQIAGMSSIVYEVRARLVEPVSSVPTHASHTRRSAAGRALMCRFQKKPDYHDRLFEFLIERIIDSLQSLISTRSAAGAGRSHDAATKGRGRMTATLRKRS